MFGSVASFEGSLFDDLRRIQQDLEDMFGARAWPSGIRAAARGTYPPINVGATAHGVDVYIFAPGLDPKVIQVSIQQNLFTVAGERKVDLPEHVQYYRQERFSGSFKRVIAVPDDADPEKVEARYVFTRTQRELPWRRICQARLQGPPPAPSGQGLAPY